ncbi:hypothetical protein ACFE04_005969 [Oxalis oulophora]
MASEQEVTSKLEWRIKVDDGSPEILSNTGPIRNSWLFLKGLLVNLIMKVKSFFRKAWDLAVADPRKVIHCLKAGLAITFVSVFYYVSPLYDGVGGNAMWAIMTVVVVFEHSVGATVYKCLNRVIGTSLAGFLALSVHWLATESGAKFEPIVVGVFVFLLASAASFSRFIPTVKARFDYGAMIFILTFSFVSISGYRVDKLLNMANARISTIIIGTSLCILIIMLVCPIWAGEELHRLIIRNMEKLANSLEGCAVEYFNQNDDGEKSNGKLLGYKCVLNSKASEESMANFARWEPAHGRFNFRHPWKLYLKIGASMRSCAYCVEALRSCLNSEYEVPGFIKKQLSTSCLKISSLSANIMKELGKSVKAMEKSTSTLDLLVVEMNSTIEEIQSELKSLPSLFAALAQPEAQNPVTDSQGKITIPPLLELIPVVTFASLLIEIASRVEDIVDSVEELAKKAEFKTNNTKSKIIPQEQQEEETSRSLQMV